MCAIWKRKVRSLPGDNDDSWGPSYEEVQRSSVSEVTGSWIDDSSSGEELPEQDDHDSDASDNADWAGPDDNENDDELIDSMEAVAFADEYHMDNTSDVYAVPDFSSHLNVSHRPNTSPTKRSRNR